MSRRARLALGAAAILVLIAGGFGLTLGRDGDASSGDTRRGSLVDDRTGAYQGVRMGDSPDRVRRVFGEPSNGPGFAPADSSPAEIGVPQTIPVPPGTRFPPDLLKYDNVAFIVGPSGVYAFIVTEDGAATTRGVAIGDSIEKARTAYPVRCIEVAGGESLLGGEEFYPSCGATLDRLRVWFGRDPIRSITLVSSAHASSG